MTKAVLKKSKAGCSMLPVIKYYKAIVLKQNDTGIKIDTQIKKA